MFKCSLALPLSEGESLTNTLKRYSACKNVIFFNTIQCVKKDFQLTEGY